jgi:hypothetical protein
MASIVRTYLIQDLSSTEMESYVSYINGDDESVEWVEKSLARREPLLILQPRCNFIIDGLECQGHISVRETGVCKCSQGHYCYNVIIEEINKIVLDNS